MANNQDDAYRVGLIIFLILITGNVVDGDSLETDKQVLINLKIFLQDQNKVNQGRYSFWDKDQNSFPCEWPGIGCLGGRVTAVDLSSDKINGVIFGNFSALTALNYLDLSANTITGGFPTDLGRCGALKFLNLSHNIIDGELNLTGLSALQVIDLSMNRISGGVDLTFPSICGDLIVANLSSNNLSGSVTNSFDDCWDLKYLDLSANSFTGDVWPGFARLREFSIAENLISGNISNIFTGNCSLQALDLSENAFSGELPGEISSCESLVSLNVWGNNFTGLIPKELGLITTLEDVILGNNSFYRDIPDSLLGLKNMSFLDLSKNNFGGDIQDIFGKFTQVKFLSLHSNSYTGGLISSGILSLQNILRLDLSLNKFSGPLPLEISQMTGLQFLILSHNQFSENIPWKYGYLPSLQALDLSFNMLNGSIPSTFGNLTSLLWLMLANNFLSGEIPKELGNCNSLLWLNLMNNQLSGNIPPELSNIGLNAWPTLLANRANDHVTSGIGECITLRRWIPADYAPFSFVYTVLSRKKCLSLWEKLLIGFGIFPVCVNGVRTIQISGYVQLMGNKLSGTMPIEFRKMQNFSMLHLGINRLSGYLPIEIGEMPLVVLNVSQNEFSGEIPTQIGQIKCLLNLDLSNNNFSGPFPISFNNLTDMSKFNVSYNPYITGVIPSTGQLATFEKDSYLGVPLLQLPSFITNSSDNSTTNHNGNGKKTKKLSAFLVFFVVIVVLIVCGILTLAVCFLLNTPSDTPNYLLEETKKGRNEYDSSSYSSSSWLSDSVKVIRLDKTAFTHADILKATGNFSEDRIIGRGGFGTVYQGVLPDGREVGVKRQLRVGAEGEKEFRAEMEVLSGDGVGWPHPNLVTLYGWCLDGAEKLLVYEYMEGGSIENLVADKIKLNWKRRLDIAIDVAKALVFLHHKCVPPIVHRDVKASNVLLDKNGKARVTDFGLARVVAPGGSHVSTMVAGTVGYVAPEYGQTWQATTKGDVYSYGVLAMELATGRRAVDGGDECLVEWAKRASKPGLGRPMGLVVVNGPGLANGSDEMCELLRVAIECTQEAPQARPNMKEVFDLLAKIPGSRRHSHRRSPSPL